MCMRYSYGKPERGWSYEYVNFYDTLVRMGHTVEFFDYMEEISMHGKEAMNHKLLARVQEWKPDVAMFSLYTDQFDAQVLDIIRCYTRTFCFFHDDTWRVEYSRFWARHFDYFSTTDLHGELKYREIGLPNAIYFPFGCNEKIFRKLEMTKEYDVSFVGAWHPYREWLIGRIRKAGIQVKAVGYRWPEGEVNQEEMVRIFNQSRINLNLSNSASWDARYLLSSPRALINRLRSEKNSEQMKARIFEVCGCGAFLLSYFVEGIAKSYLPDKEIGIYIDADDLIEKIKFYLAHDDLRETMALASYERTLREHTYSTRFHHVFSRMRLIDE